MELKKKSEMSLIALIVLIVITLALSVAALIVALTRKGETGQPGDQGPKGDQGETGPKGDPSSGQGIVVNNIAITSLQQNQETNLIGSISPTSNLFIVADSIKVGDVFRLKVNGNSLSGDTPGTVTIIWRLASGSNLMITTYDDLAHPQNFEINCDLTFTSLTTVNMTSTLLLTEPVLAGNNQTNISFDSTVDQTFVLVGSFSNNAGANVSEAIITKLV